MLRITETKMPDGQIELILEGRLVGPWVDELERAAGASPATLHLNLASVTYVDGRGALLLRRWRDLGARIEHASRFVADVLQASSLDGGNDP
jgi:hypothetical protein